MRKMGANAAETVGVGLVNNAKIYSLMVNIIPAILPKSLEDFNQHFTRVFGMVNRVQVDIVDGIFAPTKTLSPEELASVDTIVEFDAHLMVDEPIRWLERVVAGGFGRVFGQVERMSDNVAFVAAAQVAGLFAGVALDLETPVSELEGIIMDLDAVLLMSVPAGISEQTFDQRVIKKIEEVRQMREGLVICIDGGLDVPQIKSCIAGEWAAEITEDHLHRDFLDMEFAVGSHLWKDPDVKTKLEKLRQLEA